MNLYYFKDEENTYTFTTAKSTTIVNGISYEPRTLQRTRYVLDSLVKKNNISLTFPDDDDFALQYIHPTTLNLTMTIALLTGVVFYRGRLVTVRWDKNKIIMVFEQLIRLGSQYSGDRRLFQRTCPYELYGANCQATEYRHELTVVETPTPTTIRVRAQSLDTTVLTGDASIQVLRTGSDPSAKISIVSLLGGLLYLELPVVRPYLGDTTAGKVYWITKLSDITVRLAAVDPSNPVAVKHVDFTITVFRKYDVNDVKVGDTVWSSFGCLRTTNDCKTLHDNITNYGGFAGLVKPSPFKGLRGG